MPQMLFLNQDFIFHFRNFQVLNYCHFYYGDNFLEGNVNKFETVKPNFLEIDWSLGQATPEPISQVYCYSLMVTIGY